MILVNLLFILCFPLYSSPCTVVFSTMFNVIEFNAEAGGGLALVHKKWLTPRKKEVFWPPYKHQKQFTKSLNMGEEVDSVKWKLFGIEKTYYETGKGYVPTNNFPLVPTLNNASHKKVFVFFMMHHSREKRTFLHDLVLT